MGELILEAPPEAKDLFDAFAARHPQQAEVEVSKGADGATLVTLIIEHAPMISASLALLIGTIKGRGIKIRGTRDGVEIDIGGIGTQS